jgi:hypothetical protein
MVAHNICHRQRQVRQFRGLQRQLKRPSAPRYDEIGRDVVVLRMRRPNVRFRG